jgi:hypothetical protein
MLYPAMIPLLPTVTRETPCVCLAFLSVCLNIPCLVLIITIDAPGDGRASIVRDDLRPQALTGVMLVETTFRMMRRVGLAVKETRNRLSRVPQPVRHYNIDTNFTPSTMMVTAGHEAAFWDEHAAALLLQHGGHGTCLPPNVAIRQADRRSDRHG